jgi:ribosomal protein S18 acetylase RimI-like enzyme
MKPMAADLRLRPLREDEYANWRRLLVDGYATDIEVHGDTPRQAALQKAEADTERILPQALQTAGHAIYVLESDGRAVGGLWLAEREMDGRRALFVYDLHVDEQERGKGFGRGAMLLAEEEARRRGIERIELNVFGGNTVARGLYRSLGYVERAVSMGKDLGAPPPSR